MKCFAFDVDGVLFDVSARLNVARERSVYRGTNFWDEFFNEELIHLDKPREAVYELISCRIREGKIVIISGRPRRLYNLTLEQISRYYGFRPLICYMRKDNDYRPSDVIKVELIKRALESGLNIVEYHDDDLKVLKKVKLLYPQIALYLHEGDGYRVVWEGSEGGLSRYFKPAY